MNNYEFLKPKIEVLINKEITRDQFDNWIKTYNNFKMPLSQRSNKIASDKKEFINFINFIKNENSI